MSLTTVNTQVTSGIHPLPFSTRAAFIAATIPASVTRTGYIEGGYFIGVSRDTNGLITQANGQRWNEDASVRPIALLFLGQSNMRSNDGSTGGDIPPIEDVISALPAWGAT